MRFKGTSILTQRARTTHRASHWTWMRGASRTTGRRMRRLSRSMERTCTLTIVLLCQSDNTCWIITNLIIPTRSKRCLLINMEMKLGKMRRIRRSLTLLAVVENKKQGHYPVTAKLISCLNPHSSMAEIKSNKFRKETWIAMINMPTRKWTSNQITKETGTHLVSRLKAHSTVIGVLEETENSTSIDPDIAIKYSSITERTSIGLMIQTGNNNINMKLPIEGMRTTHHSVTWRMDKNTKCPGRDSIRMAAWEDLLSMVSEWLIEIAPRDGIRECEVATHSPKIPHQGSKMSISSTMWQVNRTITLVLSTSRHSMLEAPANWATIGARRLDTQEDEQSQILEEETRVKGLAVAPIREKHSASGAENRLAFQPCQITVVALLQLNPRRGKNMLTSPKVVRWVTRTGRSIASTWLKTIKKTSRSRSKTNSLGFRRFSRVSRLNRVVIRAPSTILIITRKMPPPRSLVTANWSTMTPRWTIALTSPPRISISLWMFPTWVTDR